MNMRGVTRFQPQYTVSRMPLVPVSMARPVQRHSVGQFRAGVTLVNMTIENSGSSIGMVASVTQIHCIV